MTRYRYDRDCRSHGGGARSSTQKDRRMALLGAALFSVGLLIAAILPSGMAECTARHGAAVCHHTLYP